MYLICKHPKHHDHVMIYVNNHKGEFDKNIAKDPHHTVSHTYQIIPKHHIFVGFLNFKSDCCQFVALLNFGRLPRINLLFD